MTDCLVSPNYRGDTWTASDNMTVFAKVVERGGFTAPGRLGMSTGIVSQHVRQARPCAAATGSVATARAARTRDARRGPSLI